MQFLYLFYLFTVFLHLLQSLYFIFSIDVYLIVDEKGDKTDIHILEILVIAHNMIDKTTNRENSSHC